MHEYGVVESLFRQIQEELNAQGVTDPIRMIKLRRDAFLEEECIRQAFGILSKGTLFEKASLELDVAPVHFHCSCGHEETRREDRPDPFAICPRCGKTHQLHSHHELQVVEVETV